MINLKVFILSGVLVFSLFSFIGNAQEEKAKKEEAPIGKGVEGLTKDIIKKIDDSTAPDLSEKLNLAINMLSRDGLDTLKIKVRLELIEKKISALEASAKSNANISKVKDLISDPGFKKKALEILDKPNFSDEISKIFKENSLTPQDIKDFVELRKMDKTKSDIKLALGLIAKMFSQMNPSISGIPLANSDKESFGKEVENLIAILSSKPAPSVGSDSGGSSDAFKDVFKELLGINK